MEVKVTWSYTGPGEENLGFRRVLYAYLHPHSTDVLYVGKADYCTVNERLNGPHKQRIFSAMVNELGLSEIHAIVGMLHIPISRKFSSELLSDIESLLIMSLQPAFNQQAKQSRISRPGLAVKCTGDWPLTQKTFRDA